jgi:hypothetical protein
VNSDAALQYWQDPTPLYVSQLIDHREKVFQQQQQQQQQQQKHKKLLQPSVVNLDKKKKSIPVRKLLEMERKVINEANNDENDLSDANRPPHSSSSILSSLERLVETSFKPNPSSSMDYVTQQVMAAKRAFGMAFGTDVGHLESDEAKRAKHLDENKEDEVEEAAGVMDGSRTTTPADKDWSRPSSHTSSSTELKFLKYTELAKELSGR